MSYRHNAKRTVEVLSVSVCTALQQKNTKHKLADLILNRNQEHSVSMAIETPGSNGAFGPMLEAAATTFPHAPRLIAVEAARSDAEASTVVVRFKLSEVRELAVSTKVVPVCKEYRSPFVCRLAFLKPPQHGVSYSCCLFTRTTSVRQVNRVPFRQRPLSTEDRPHEEIGVVCVKMFTLQNNTEHGLVRRRFLPRGIKDCLN